MKRCSASATISANSNCAACHTPHTHQDGCCLDGQADRKQQMWAGCGETGAPVRSWLNVEECSHVEISELPFHPAILLWLYTQGHGREGLTHLQGSTIHRSQKVEATQTSISR